ncbi:MAG: hypothetical protein ACUVYA_12200 [Planctomycetota bacterium]
MGSAAHRGSLYPRRDGSPEVLVLCGEVEILSWGRCVDEDAEAEAERVAPFHRDRALLPARSPPIVPE